MDASVSIPPVSDEPGVLPRLSVTRAVLLQILPGIPVLAAYMLMAPRFVAANLPNAFALFLAILFVEVPVTWAIMIWIARKEGGRLSFASLFPFASKLSARRLFALGIPAAFVSVMLMMGLQKIVSEPIRMALFGWVPAWAVYSMTPAQMSMLSGEAKATLLVLTFVSGVIVGAGTQELFARGFLLPRIAHIGPISVVVSALSFAAMHLISPWSWPVFAVPALLWAILGYRERSTWLPVVSHVGMIAIMWFGMLASFTIGR